MSICIPALELFVHTIRASLQSNEDKVYGAFDKRSVQERYWKKSSFWNKVSRVWLPIGYFVIALVILLPGIINITMLELL